MKNIAVIEYGLGNLCSVMNALKYIGFSAEVTNDKEKIRLADAIILPGVGAFPKAAETLRNTGLDRLITDCTRQKPLLGICLGMQLLFDSSEEISMSRGLSLVRGDVKKIITSAKLPHIGWNNLEIKRENLLTKKLDGSAYFYFVHSFCAQTENAGDLLAAAKYGGEEFAAIVKNGNAFGCQFHPEKSGEAGLQILKNFGELA